MPDPQPDATRPAPPDQPAEGGQPQEALPPAKARLLELARQESERAAKLRATREDFAHRREFLMRDVPPRFFALAAGLREAVERFNATLTEDDPKLPLHYEETPGVTLKDLGADDLRVTVRRHGARFELGLRLMTRSGVGTSKTSITVPLIEGYGTYGRDHERRVMMRIEGWVEGGKTIYWYSLDFKRMQMDLDELPDRIAMSIVQVDPVLLYRSLTPPAATDGQDG
jgi:hypothetical protein